MFQHEESFLIILSVMILLDVFSFVLSIPAVPTVFGIRDSLHGRQFFHGPVGGGGVGWG